MDPVPEAPEMRSPLHRGAQLPALKKDPWSGNAPRGVRGPCLRDASTAPLWAGLAEATKTENGHVDSGANIWIQILPLSFSGCEILGRFLKSHFLKLSLSV
jgi:hypothetical protein